MPCTSGADCPELITTCRNGACNQNVCGAAGTLPDGGQNGVYSGKCNAAGTNDGTCYADYTAATSTTAAAVYWLCYQGGPLAKGVACNATADATTPSELCAAGSLCFSPDGGASGICQDTCDPTASSNTCGSGYGCEAFDTSDDLAPQWGVCYTESGGCLETGFSNEFSPCAANSQCNCISGVDMACFSDPTLASTAGNLYGNTTFCERTCSSTSGCPLPYSACKNNNWCTYNFCGNAASGVGMSAVCNAAGTNDGTCDPIPNAAGTGVAFGVCFQDGTTAVGATCDPSSTRATDPNGACTAGALCLNNGTSDECYVICNPDAGTLACSGSTPTCTAAGSPDIGVCE